MKFIKTLCVALALIMAFITPAQALSAVRQTSYISEIVTVTAGSFDEAKAQLEAAGYKIVENSNLNSTLRSGVYLGYKETTDKKEAITDIAAMNMTGKFSYSDYEQIMTDYRENIEQTIDNIETFIEEFQQNHDSGRKNASLAYTALNLFKDDDSGKTMGDYFLGYDFSEKSRESMTDTIMQANSEIVMSMIRAISFAGDPDDTTIIERMAETGPDGIEEKYARLFPTVAKARQAMAAEYGAVADTLYKDWEYFYEYILGVENNTVSVGCDGSIVVNEEAFEEKEAEPVNTSGLTAEEKEFIEAVSDISEVPETFDATTDLGLYSLLAGTDFGGGTLLDFFKRPAAAVDKTELYVIVDSMSEGQRGQVEFLGIKEILEGAFSDSEEDDGAESDAVQEYSELTDAVEPVSIFDGVDRSVFDDGVAFTSSAVQHETLTGKSWLDKLGGIVGGDLSYWNTTTIVCWLATAGLAATGIVATVIGKKALEKIPNLEYLKGEADKVLSRAKDRFNRDYGFVSDDGVQHWLVSDERRAEYLAEYENNLKKCTANYNKAQSTVKLAGIIKVASFILLFVVLAFDIYTLVDFFMKEKPIEETVPHHIMSTAKTAYGEDYVYYAAAKTLSGDAADTNNHEADPTVGWLVLYTTKEASAGDPICSDDIKVVTGTTDFGENASFAHLFNETAAINLTDPNYTGVPDTTDGTYIIFDCSASEYAASAISNGAAALIAAAALAVGAVGGSLITAAAKKKKETAEEA